MHARASDPAHNIRISRSVPPIFTYADINNEITTVKFTSAGAPAVRSPSITNEETVSQGSRKSKRKRHAYRRARPCTAHAACTGVRARTRRERRREREREREEGESEGESGREGETGESEHGRTFDDAIVPSARR